jgi:hypothetical protein
LAIFSHNCELASYLIASKRSRRTCCERRRAVFETLPYPPPLELDMLGVLQEPRGFSYPYPHFHPFLPRGRTVSPRLQATVRRAKRDVIS